MFDRPSSQQGAPSTPNPADPVNGLNDSRRKRLIAGGRTATFLTQAQTAAMADRSPATLTGLSGGGGSV